MKNLKNITMIEKELTTKQKNRLHGILVGLLRFERVNKSDMPLIAKIIYQSIDARQYKTLSEHEAEAYIRREMHHRDDMEF